MTYFRCCQICALSCAGFRVVSPNGGVCSAPPEPSPHNDDRSKAGAWLTCEAIREMVREPEVRRWPPRPKSGPTRSSRVAGHFRARKATGCSPTAAGSLRSARSWRPTGYSGPCADRGQGLVRRGALAEPAMARRAAAPLWATVSRAAVYSRKPPVGRFEVSRSARIVTASTNPVNSSAALRIFERKRAASGEKSSLKSSKISA
jgi:hypothetical protein